MYAVIDIGSNTIRLSVYDIHDREIKPMFNRKKMSALISYVDENGCMTDQGIQKAVSVLSGFKKIIENTNIEHVYPFATASFRNIRNRKRVLAEIKENTGYDIDVISGEEEGICGFVGSAYHVELDSGLLVDIGGGSTELVFYKDRKICSAYSIPMGSLSLFANFVSGLIPTKDESHMIKKYVREQLKTVEPLRGVPSAILCGVGGTSRAACKLVNDYFDLPLSNRSMGPDQMKRLVKSFYHEADGIDRILRVVPERIHTIIPGMLLLRTIAKYYGCEKIIVSEYGVREGYLIRTVLGWENGEEKN
jgi:exopolyphosphatase/guanosine-5'-triphosphate,3'-diphosphate pyrophosphatase